MDEAKVREILLTILTELVEDPPEYKPNADIFEDFGLDSLDQISFLFSVEEQFGVKIVDETFEEQKLQNFDLLVAYLIQQQNNAG